MLGPYCGVPTRLQKPRNARPTGNEPGATTALRFNRHERQNRFIRILLLAVSNRNESLVPKNVVTQAVRWGLGRTGTALRVGIFSGLRFVALLLVVRRTATPAATGRAAARCAALRATGGTATCGTATCGTSARRRPIGVVRAGAGAISAGGFRLGDETVIVGVPACKGLPLGGVWFSREFCQ